MENLNVNGVSWNVSEVSGALFPPPVSDSSVTYFESSFVLNDKVNFADMTWDFSEKKKPHELKGDYIYTFDDITTLAYRIFTKRCVLRELFSNDNRYTSVARMLPDIKRFVKFLESERFILQPHLINERVVKVFIETKCAHWKERTRNSMFSTLRKFFMEIELELEDFTLSSFDKILQVDEHLFNAEVETGKTPNIPSLLFKRIIQLALKDINDTRYDDYVTVAELAKKLNVDGATVRQRIKKNWYPGTVKVNYSGSGLFLIPKVYMHTNVKSSDSAEEARATEFIKNPSPSKEERMVACMILILSQVGMRLGEFLLLEVNRLHETKIFEGQEPAYYMEFFTYKTSLSKDGRWAETFMTDIAVKAYNTLEILTKDRRKEGQKALYATSKGGFYSKGTIDAHLKQFFFRHQDALGFETLSQEQLEKLSKWVISESDVRNRVRGMREHHIGKTICKVNSHQFRVAVANELRKKNIPLQWIRAHMNHLEEEMTQHYFRYDEKRVRVALINRASKDGSSLEMNPDNTSDSEIRKELSNPSFQDAYKTVNKFLKKNKFNIYKDLDTIIELLSDNPLNETDLGYCINAMGKICERQERLATLERWYYMKPHVPDVEYFDFTYRRLLDKLKLVEHNQAAASKNSKYVRQYEIELNALEKFYSNKFLPELTILKEELQNKGSEAISSKYPNLQDIIPNIGVIEKEAQEWLRKLKLVI